MKMKLGTHFQMNGFRRRLVFFDTEVKGTSAGMGGVWRLAYFNLFSPKKKHCQPVIIKL